MENLSVEKLAVITGGNSTDPGTNYWIGGNGNSNGGSTIGGNWGGNLGDKIAICIAYGLAGRRGPFGCNS